MKNKYWDTFYAQNSLGSGPSTFAEWCWQHGGLSEHEVVLEIGCGNGRDSFFFAEKGVQVVAMDASQVAIETNQKKAQGLPFKDNCTFISERFALFESLRPVIDKRSSNHTAIYCRFVLHAVTKSEAEAILEFSWAYLSPKERMYLEFRTTRDPMFHKGDQVSATERMTDHYRRFIESGEFRADMSRRGWIETYFLESDGLSQYKDDDPVLARLILEKP